MCRKCGEPDRRGSSKVRRHRRKRLLEGAGGSYGGNGVITVCAWCHCLLGEHAGYLAVGGRRLPIRRLEQDRIMPGGPYALYNLVPACGPCNKGRAYDEQVFDEGCWFGSGRRREAVA